MMMAGVLHERAVDDTPAAGSMIRTSTPRRTASFNSSMASPCGRKYGFWMMSLFRAPPMAR